MRFFKFFLLLFLSVFLNFLAFMGMVFAFAHAEKPPWDAMTPGVRIILKALDSVADLLMNFYFFAGLLVVLIDIILFFWGSKKAAVWILRGSYALPIIILLMIIGEFALMPNG